MNELSLIFLAEATESPNGVPETVLTLDKVYWFCVISVTKAGVSKTADVSVAEITLALIPQTLISLFFGFIVLNPDPVIVICLPPA